MKDRIGEKNYNSFGSEIIIKEYRGSMDIDVYFPKYNWVSKNKRYTTFKDGTIKCPYEKRYYNKGYLGVGEYKTNENGKDTKCYTTWHHMLERCYSERCQEKHTSYKGCEVCEEWLNFQNFARWYYENYYGIEGERMCLDKDILHKRNKIYSPDTCIFVPQRINNLFVKNDASRGNLPIGVIKHKCRYMVQVCDGYSHIIKLGIFETSHEAFLMYKFNKELVIENIAKEYKDKIPQKLYVVMINYKVEIND